MDLDLPNLNLKLRDASEEELFEELKRRNKAVVLIKMDFCDDDGDLYDFYFHGGCSTALGMLKMMERDMLDDHAERGKR